MSELYPSDADLNALSGGTDTEQEVLYLTAGESPYYTSFYKMLYRLLDVARRAGDLRVYKDGELTFGVRSGRFFDGAALRQVAGVTGQALTNNATNAVYLDADGAVQVSTSGFPAPSEPHVRLARIVTAAGAYSHDDIEDCRGSAMFALSTGLSAAQLQSGLPGLAVTAGDESADARTVTCQLIDAAGNDLAERFRVRLWVCTSDYGPPDATDNTVAVTTGTQLREITADADYEVITDANGTVAVDITVSGAASRYVCAEVDGRIASSGELTWSA